MGHYKFFVHDADAARDIDRLTENQRRRLRQAGAIGDLEGKTPLWRVEKKYHWTQTFPAHAVVSIRHQYTPVLGNSNAVGGGESLLETGHAENGSDNSPSVCPTPELQHTLLQDEKKSGHVVGIRYVDFILTTANTWKQPIEDFTLNVERSALDHDPYHPATDVNLVSFCWNGPVTKVDANHFSAHAKNFVPKKELRIGFLQGYLMDEKSRGPGIRHGEIPPSHGILRYSVSTHSCSFAGNAG